MGLRAGQKLVKYFFDNTGGLNLADSFLRVQENQTLGGFNYDYINQGGFAKSLCPSRINSSPDAALKTFGVGLRFTKEGVKQVIRAAGTKIQYAPIDTTYTNLAEDTAAATTDFIPSDNTKPVYAQMFVQADVDTLWLSNGGMDGIYGVVSDTTVTKNGVETPTGTVTTSVAGGSSSWTTTGTYRYAIVLQKASTLAIGNAALDVSATISSTTDAVTIDWSGVSIDTTKYSKVYLYRSIVTGASGFTAGDLVAIIDSTTTSYVDNGTYYATAVNVPRAGNTVLDNSPLDDTLTYGPIVAFKRRLGVASGSTVYLSDINKPESWPATNAITLPSGGPITGLAVIGYATDASPSTEEYLVIFKETELWIINGNDYTDWDLVFVDYAGTLNQNLVVNTSGYLFFIDNRGIYMFDGSSKPLFVSRPIQNLWGPNGTLDRVKLDIGCGVFFRAQNQVIWYLSDTNIGEQKLVLKLDLKNTVTRLEGSNLIRNRIMDGCFIFGKVNDPVYAAAGFIYPTSSSQEDILVTGDDAGYLYRQFYSTSGVGSNDYDFTYKTKFHDMDAPRIVKRFEKVIVWVENLGNWDLTLDYWTDFRSSDNNKNSVSVTINQSTSSDTGLWDVGHWDVASWDSYTSNVKPIVFNLNGAPFNNSEGEVLQLQFRNQNSNQPINIYGYAVMYSEIALR